MSIAGQEGTKIKVYNAISWTLVGLYYSLYCSAHWIFAMKYWITSYRLGKGRNLSLVNVVYYFILILNIAIPAFEAVAEGMDLK